uniref:Uncharacterized protein n=1 Tax=Triticum urartu TaxID=4572 RepID=A0A8R7TZV8_TRIUA
MHGQHKACMHARRSAFGSASRPERTCSYERLKVDSKTPRYDLLVQPATGGGPRRPARIGLHSA